MTKIYDFQSPVRNVPEVPAHVIDSVQKPYDISEVLGMYGAMLEQ